MHVILMTRGLQQSRDIWKTFMQAQWFWFRQKPIAKYEQDIIAEDGKTIIHKKGDFIKNPDGTYKHVAARYAEDVLDKDGKTVLHKKGDIIYNEDGTEKELITLTKVQGALRPFELWEYVIPQESLQEVLAMQNAHQHPLRKDIQAVAWGLRKLMGAKKIPDMPDLAKKEYWQVTDKFIPMAGMAVYPIGIREDPTQDFIFGDVGYYQEGL